MVVTSYMSECKTPEQCAKYATECAACYGADALATPDVVPTPKPKAPKPNRHDRREKKQK